MRKTYNNKFRRRVETPSRRRPNETRTGVLKIISPTKLSKYPCSKIISKYKLLRVASLIERARRLQSTYQTKPTPSVYEHKKKILNVVYSINNITRTFENLKYSFPSRTVSGYCVFFFLLSSKSMKEYPRPNN